MKMEKHNNPARNLMELFFQAPTVSAILVFDDMEYFGAVLKRDVEIGMREGSFNLFENISLIPIESLERYLFASKADPKTKIPTIDKTGKPIRLISHREFLSQFYFENFLQKFELQNVWDYLEHPLLVTNYFKKILYLNREALLLCGKDFIGKSFSRFSKNFDIKIDGENLLFQKNDHFCRLLMSQSESKDFFYRVYQLFPINA